MKKHAINLIDEKKKREIFHRGAKNSHPNDINATNSLCFNLSKEFIL